MKQVKEDGTIKKAEPFTKAIALYLAKHLDLNAIVKIKDTGDSNHNDKDRYKDEILKIIDKYGLPQEWNNNGEFGPERYVEVHVWSDETINKYRNA